MKNTIAALLTAAALSLGSAHAQTTVWKTDKAHSAVKFTVSHMVIAEVPGRFKDFDATLQTTKDDFSDAKIDVTIKTASIDTDNEGRDRHLRSDDFLNVEKFPELRFKSTSIQKTGEGTYTITGDLSIRDVTKAVVLDTKYNGAVVDPMGNTKAGFKAITTIDRFDYGVKWNKAIETGGLIAGKNVDITLVFEFAKQKAN